MTDATGSDTNSKVPKYNICAMCDSKVIAGGAHVDCLGRVKHSNLALKSQIYKQATKINQLEKKLRELS